MLPSQFKKLLDTLRSQLSSIQEAINRQTNAKADEQATDRENEREHTRSLRSIAHEIEAGNNSSTAAHRENRKQQGELISAQWWTVRWTAGAFIAASVYALIAVFQGCLMRQTYTEMQNQTKAARQAAYAACVSAQVARQALIEEKSGETATKIEATASAEQAIAATASERALLTVSFPPPDRYPTNKELELKYTIKDDGKSDARNISIRGMAVEVAHNATPPFSYMPKKNIFTERVDTLKAGETFPEQKSAAGYNSIYYAFFAFDESGKRLIYDPDAVRRIVMQHKSDIVVYGGVAYADFSGRHWQHFCRRISFLNAGETESDTNSKDEKRCFYYSQEGDYQRPEPTVNSPPKESAIPEVKCEVPK